MAVGAREHEADADERNSKVARLFREVPGDHAFRRDVDGQRLVQRELRRDPGDGACPRHAAFAADRRLLPPRAGAGANCIEGGDGAVVDAQELRVARRELQTLGLDEMQQQHGIVAGEAPERIVQLTEDLARGRVPAPPQVAGELVEASDPFRERWQGDVAIHRPRAIIRCLSPACHCAACPRARRTSPAADSYMHGRRLSDASHEHSSARGGGRVARAARDVRRLRHRDGRFQRAGHRGVAEDLRADAWRARRDQ